MSPVSADFLPPIVLAFAASDPTGGAGIQADIMTLASMGCHPLSVITAITVQDTAGVEDVLPIDADWIADQARAVLEDVPVAAVLKAEPLLNPRLVRVFRVPDGSCDSFDALHLLSENIQAAGGECVEDVRVLARDGGLTRLLHRPLPSPDAPSGSSQTPPPR